MIKTAITTFIGTFLGGTILLEMEYYFRIELLHRAHDPASPGSAADYVLISIVGSILTTVVLLICFRLFGKATSLISHIFVTSFIAQIAIYLGIFALETYIGSLSVLVFVPISYISAYLLDRFEGGVRRSR